MILVAMDLRWKFLLQTKDLKEDYQVGLEQPSWLQWKYSINGWLAKKTINNMEQLKFKSVYDLFNSYILLYPELSNISLSILLYKNIEKNLI